MKNLTLQERIVLCGLIVLLIAGGMTRMWRYSRSASEEEGPPPRVGVDGRAPAAPVAESAPSGFSGTH